MAGSRTTLHSPQCPSWPRRPATISGELLLLPGRAQTGTLGPGPKVPGSREAASGFRKGRGTRDQIANICWIIEKAREFQKNIYFCFIDYAKAFDCVDHSKLWKILKEMGIPDHLTCFLRNLHAGQEATGRTGHGIKTGS